MCGVLSLPLCDLCLMLKGAVDHVLSLSHEPRLIE